MRLIILAVTLLALVNFTVQLPKIGRFCPQNDKLKQEFSNTCIDIKCKVKKLLSSNFTIETGKGVSGLHPQFHIVKMCKPKCRGGQVLVGINLNVHRYRYPQCCQDVKCINSFNVLNKLKTVSDEDYVSDYSDD